MKVLRNLPQPGVELRPVFLANLHLTELQFDARLQTVPARNQHPRLFFFICATNRYRSLEPDFHNRVLEPIDSFFVEGSQTVTNKNVGWVNEDRAHVHSPAAQRSIASPTLRGRPRGRLPGVYVGCSRIARSNTSRYDETSTMRFLPMVTDRNTPERSIA
jgi:hypothetical protein